MGGGGEGEVGPAARSCLAQKAGVGRSQNSRYGNTRALFTFRQLGVATVPLHANDSFEGSMSTTRAGCLSQDKGNIERGCCCCSTPYCALSELLFERHFPTSWQEAAAVRAKFGSPKVKSKPLNRPGKGPFHSSQFANSPMTRYQTIFEIFRESYAPG